VVVPDAFGERLVGRDLECLRIDSLLRQARENGAALVVTGERGMGKSSLLRMATRLAADDETATLSSGAVEFESQVEYAALHQLLMPHEAAFAALHRRHDAALRTCLGMADGPPPRRSTVASAVIALLSSLSSETPILLVVDDLHWVDEASASVLTAIATHLEGMRVGFLGALRDGGRSFFDPGGVPRLHLHPLSPEAAVELLDRREPRIPAGARSRLLWQAGGNPLALLQLSTPGSTAHRRTHVESASSPRLRELLTPALENLPRSTRDFLLLSALDTSGELRVILAAGAGRVAEGDVVRSVRHGLVTVEHPGRTLRFAHPLIRAVIIDVAGSTERRDAHQRLGEAETDHPVRRAQHLADAVPAPDEANAALLEDSARVLLRQGDPDAAIAASLRSADLSDGTRGRGRRLAHAAYLAADVTGDLEQGSGLIADAGAGAAGAETSLDTIVATAIVLLNGRGDVDSAHRLLVQALDTPTLMDGVAETSVCKALEVLLATCFFGGRRELWEPFAAHLRRLGPQIPIGLHLCANTFASPARNGVMVLDELRSAIRALDAEPDMGQVVLVSRAAFYVDEIDGCRSALWRVINEGLARGAVVPAINAWMLLAFHAYLDGRWVHASSYARQGLALCEDHGYELLAWPGRYCLALIAAARGEEGTCSAACDEMIRWAQPRGLVTLTAYAHHVTATAALGRRDFESAYREARAVSPPGVIDPALPHALWLMMDLVEAALHSDRRKEAVAHVKAMRALGVGALSSRFALIMTGCEAMVASSDSLELFEVALATPGSDRWPFELARVQLAYGERLHRDRLHVRARQQLSSALEVFELLAATPWMSRAQSLLSASSGRQSRTHRRGTLTARELEVATLAAAGLANNQIATRLNASPRTISAHLSHVFAKLSIRSRAGLNDALARQP
jgi:DNA-binding CsgD family transcriptional regulator